MIKNNTCTLVTLAISTVRLHQSKSITMWKWFQVLGGHNLDSLCLMDYSFINTALENKIKILERIGKLPGGHPHSVTDMKAAFNPHLSRSAIFFSLHNLSISASFRAAINLSTSAFDFPDSSLLRATSCSRSLRRSVMSGHFLVASSAFWVFWGGSGYMKGVDGLGTMMFFQT